jgi:hypothetical protein
MKTTKNSKPTKAEQRMQRIADYLTGLTIFDLERLCDDPARNESGQEVQAILTPGRGGYVLSARDGQTVYPIIEDDGRPVTFRSVEGAIERLADVPYLLPQVEVNASQWITLH